MILLQAVRIGKSFGAHRVLDNVNLIVQTGERAGIVGVNGAGKSTLLKILVGELEADAGDVVRAKNITMSYLAQSNSGLESHRSIREEMLTAFGDLTGMEQRIREIEQQLSDPGAKANSDNYRQLLATYDNLSADFANKGGFTYEKDLNSVLRGLNFQEADYDTPVNTLSGGQKTRLALARCLLGAPDLLILDEPTNYLDMDNLTWLERYLREYKGAVLAVSHDRYFLDSVVKVTYELDRNGQITRYTGNYSSFAQQKTAAIEQQWKAYKKQQEEIARMEDFIRRNMAAKDTTKRAQSRQKALERIERIPKPEQERRVRVSFTAGREANQEVLVINNLTIGYPGNLLSKDINFTVSKGERVALIGPNGIGKSTLLKTIAGSLPPIKGHVNTGNLVLMSYYDQEHKGLNLDKDVLQELWDRYPHMNEVDIRTALGGFLFSGDDVKKKVADLSGGERSRLALAILMLRQSNFLLLDEPTNHLDFPGKEALESALADYPGAILYVSHDRYFINKFATRILDLSFDQLTSYQGNYDYYLEKKNLSQAVSQEAAPKQKEKPLSQEKQLFLQKKDEERQKRKHQRSLSQLEETIATQEELIDRLTKELDLPEINQDYQACQERQTAMDQAKAVLEESMEKWLELLDSGGEE